MSKIIVQNLELIIKKYILLLVLNIARLIIIINNNVVLYTKRLGCFDSIMKYKLTLVPYI